MSPKSDRAERRFDDARRHVVDRDRRGCAMLQCVDQRRESEYPADALSGPAGWRDAMDAHVREAWGPLSRGIAELVPVQGVPSIDRCSVRRIGYGDAIAAFDSNFSFSFEPTRPCSVTGARPGS